MASSSLPATRTHDSPQSIVCLVLFLLAAFVTIRPIAVPVRVPSFVPSLLYNSRLRDDRRPLPRRTYHLHIDLNTGPILAVLVLLAARCIGIVEFRAGIKGVGDVRPYDILLLFLSLAYIAISLDGTGALRYLAFWVAKKGGTSGRKLYFFLYLFFIILGGIVGNDPVILSGTAFLAYFTKACTIEPPTAWISAEFMAANLASMVFVTSNPTNLVISSASGINFIYFSGWTIIPAMLSSCVLYLVLVVQFFPTRWSGQLVPRRLKPPEVDPRGELLDFPGAIFKAVLLGVTLASLIICSVFIHGLYVWWVTVPAALLAVLWDFVLDYKFGAHKSPRLSDEDVVMHASRSSMVCDSNLGPADADSRSAAGTRVVLKHSRWTLPRVFSVFSKRFPTIHSAIARMPWALVPFAFSFFILVDSLSSSGWIGLWAGWLSKVIRNNDIAAVFFTGIICILLCNISTNIGATLILSNIIYDDKFRNANPSSRVQYGALFAIAACSNIGAYSFVFPASLAGLLWRGILRQKNVEMKSIDFVRYNFLPLVLTTIAALAVVVAEVRVIFPEG